MKKYAVKTVQALVAIAVLLGIGFVGGLTAPQAKIPASTTQVAYETTPGPYGSGVLGAWSGLAHGVYCYPSTGKRTVRNVAPSGKNSATTACAGEDIRLYGDSITNGGKEEFAAEMSARGLTTMVDAWSGRPTTPVADAIQAETAFPPVVIVASGTNDIFNPTVMAAQINRIKSHIASVSPGTELFWVDVQATRWGQTEYTERNDQRNSMAVNLAIYQNIPVNHVIQWTARFMSSPGLMGTYLVDGVHPKSTLVTATTTGYDYWAAILRGWLVTLGGA